MRSTIWLTTLLVLTACGQRDVRRAEGEAVEQAVRNSGHAAPAAAPVETPTPTPQRTTAANTVVTDGWIGRWRGVEGLNLVISADPAAGPGHYTLEMQYSLDDKGSFPGVADGEVIRFTRPDGPQILTATDGEATGLKWLADKKDCLTVKPGEGYCRD
ncbi:hypothetical protein [Sphingomonas sp. 3-13AW]|jgi:hypothetical protein|uniref:hypothetical protein n=1 Tax=Sphingomonas sp. 3-13AW TaxID=3050450 RepID=UPI003BB5C8F5